jgi:iron complex transport system permease protein
MTIWLGLLLLAVVVLVIALSFGSAAVGVSQSWRALLDVNHPAHGFIVGLRLPRIAAGFAIGALLAMAGALLQVLLRNPLAEPYVLGLSGGAALGALTAIALSLPAFIISSSAAVGAGVSLAVLLLVAQREFMGSAPAASERLLLTGVMLAAVWGALIALLQSLSPEKQQSMFFWLMGDLSSSAVTPWVWIVLLLVLGVALWDAPRLNLLARGEETAAALGVRVGALKLRIVILAALAAGTAVALAGTIGFVGLIVPHLLRLLWRNDQRVLLPACVLLGGTVVVLADTLARTVIAPRQLPVGAIMAVIGAPIFLALLWRRSKS